MYKTQYFKSWSILEQKQTFKHGCTHVQRIPITPPIGIENKLSIITHTKRMIMSLFKTTLIFTVYQGDNANLNLAINLSHPGLYCVMLWWNDKKLALR